MPSGRRAYRSGLLIAATMVLVGCSTGSGAPSDAGATPADCSPAMELPAGSSAQTIEFAGQQRRYLLHVPPGYDGTQETPVVYLFHGLGGSADIAVAYTGWAAKADDENAIVVAPQGAGKVPSWDFVSPTSKDGSDLAFVKQLTAKVNSQACVDRGRTYVAGMSNGSALAFAFACSGDFDFAAYGAVAAAFYRPRCDESPPASIIYFHGTGDKVVPFYGGPTPIAPVDPVPKTMALWAQHNECDPQADQEQVSPKVTRYAWPSCAPGTDLRAYVIAGGGHTWPGAVRSQTPSWLGGTTDDISATDLMWDFFAEHPADR